MRKLVDASGVEPICFLAKEACYRYTIGPLNWWTRAELNRHLLNAIEMFYR